MNYYRRIYFGDNNCIDVECIDGELYVAQEHSCGSEHFSRDEARKLAEALLRFADTGSLE